ncbi:MAG: hypothetical protein ACP5NW_04755, partial [Candidatus Woesearchaeota archaeon]
MDKKLVWSGILVLGLVMFLPNVTAYCGDGSCDDGYPDYESAYNCIDCAVCGDDFCSDGESSYCCECASCGDTNCTCGETTATCPSDCLSPEQQCYRDKGIWCAQNVCIYFDYIYSRNQDCTITKSQTIDFASTSTSIKKYYFKSLAIPYGYNLTFKNSLAPYISQSASCSNCGVAALGTVGDRNGGKGGDGGYGGDVASKGLPGTKENYETCRGHRTDDCDDCSQKYAASGGSAGASVSLYADIIYNNGTISVEGTAGSNGDPGEKECFWITVWPGRQYFGNGGVGGGGGGGAGNLNIYTQTLNGTGRFSAQGGQGGLGGGPGGQAYNEDSKVCHPDSEDRSGGAGGGGGGAGGNIHIEADIISTRFNDSTLTDAAGQYNPPYLIGGGKTLADFNGQCKGGSWTSWVPPSNFNGTPGKDGLVIITSKKASELQDIYGAEIVNACNNRIDDDYDNLIDMADNDCFDESFCKDNSGPITQNTLASFRSIGGNESAINATDGCCGDDLSPRGVYDFGYDYGYIANRTHLCYNSLVNPDEWQWLSADNSVYQNFEVIPFRSRNNTNKTVDFISNSTQWFYCAANPSFTQGITGTALSSGSHPSYQIIEPGTQTTINCKVLMDAMFQSQILIPFEETSLCGTSEYNTPCCQPNIIVPLGSPPDLYACLETYCYYTYTQTMKQWAENTYISSIEVECDQSNPIEKYFCTTIPLDTPSASTGTSDTSGVGTLEKTSCISYDSTSCVALFEDTQVPLPGEEEDCDDLSGATDCESFNYYCVNGKFIATPSTGYCCYNSFGEQTSCVEKITVDAIDNEEECMGDIFNNKGIVYDAGFYECQGNSLPIGNGDTSCCLGYLVYKNTISIDAFLLNQRRYPVEQLLCYNDISGNYIAECVWDNSTPNTQKLDPTRGFTGIEGKDIDNMPGRVFTTGGSIHTLLSFDELKQPTSDEPTFSPITDMIGNFSVASRSFSKTNFGYIATLPVSTTFRSAYEHKKFNISSYDYLEFDILYPTPECRLFMLLITNDSVAKMEREINITPYLTAGDRPGRWTHVKIPIDVLRTYPVSPLSTNESYTDIVFRDYVTPDVVGRIVYNIMIDSIKLT